MRVDSADKGASLCQKGRTTTPPTPGGQDSIGAQAHHLRL
jgi:hypothetical protein